MADRGEVPEARAVVLWRPREVPADERQARETRKAEYDARLAVAEQRRKQAELVQVGIDLVLSQFKKWLTLAGDPDFANAVGPLEPAIVMKIAEFVTKEHRLDTGQATENIAHAIRPSIDFSKLTQEERNRWKELAEKARAAGGE